MLQTRELKSTLAAIAATAALLGGLAVPAVAQSAKQAPPAAKEKVVGPVNLNTAAAAELETLPGVGPAMATRILEYRQKNGGFKKIEELMNVRGVGEKMFLKLKPMITVAPPKAVGL